MIRNLFLATLGAALLGGCVTGYQYRGGSGDYYYGQPSVDYYDDGYYGSYGYPYGYGYPGGWNGTLGFGLGYGGYYGPYGYPYGYPYGGYGDPYWRHRHPVIVVPDPPPTAPPTHPRPGHPDRPDRDGDGRHDRFIMRRPLSGHVPRAVPDAAIPMPSAIGQPGRAPLSGGSRQPQSITLPTAPLERIQRAPAVQRTPARAPASERRDSSRRERDDGLKPRP